MPNPSLTDPSDPDASLLGPYRLEEEIGRGGQGVVYRATDTRIGRRVAVKVLRGIGPGGEKLLAYFKREAAIAARLDHPGLCPVYDAEVEEGTPYIAMRFVEGRTLLNALVATDAHADTSAETVVLTDRESGSTTVNEPISDRSSATGRPALMRAVGLVEKAARALHAAHEVGVIHRDVKPGNIMVTPDDEAVVMDFGLARDDASDLHSLTQSGDLLGTPAYMSPEQLAHQAVRMDRRTDVWSLGVTLYECVTGTRPFDGPTREALYKQILTSEPPDPSTLNPGISRDLATVIVTALSKSRDHRYQTALALAEELRRVREYEPIVARPITSWTRLVRWTQRNPALAAATFAAALILVAGTVVSTALAARASDNAKRASANANRAEAALVDWERLADKQVLQDLVREADEQLWPAHPDKILAMDSWLDRARALADRLESHRVTLASFRSRAKNDAASAQVSFTDPRDQIRHDGLRDLVAGLEILVDPQRRGVVTIASMSERLEFAKTVRRRTVDELAGEWKNAGERVLNRARYGGLRLSPQLGLVPLGPDPRSGLEEFAVLQTGEPPVRDPETGALRLDDTLPVILVLVPGGSFSMGAQGGDPSKASYCEDARDDEGPPHEVRLDAFFLSKFEMTQHQWLRLTGANPSNFQPGKLRITLRNPVEQVSWNACMQLLERLGLTLPTEAQWEYACRSDTQTPWSSGLERESLRGAANLADRAAARAQARFPDIADWPDLDDGYPVHAPVGTYRANGFGLHDMHGNVWEWCRDAYVLHYGNHPAAPGDGARIDPTARYRATRSGSFDSAARHARSSRRSNGTPRLQGADLGVRPAMKLVRD